MSGSRERFMVAHQQLIDEYMEEHPEADEDKVYEMMADRALGRMADNLANQIDYYRMMEKEK